MTRSELDCIEARCRAATPAPWRATSDGLPALRNVTHYIRYGDLEDDDGRLIAQAVGADTPRKEIAEFIAAARQDVPDLIAEVRRLRELIIALGGQEELEILDGERCSVCGKAPPDAARCGGPTGVQS
jgi:hypothetical protein